MIFRVTQKLAKKIKVLPAISLPLHDNPFLDWTANLFMVSRSQYIILTNSRSLYSVVMAGKGVTNGVSFVEQGLKALHDYMAFDGTEYLFKTHAEPHVDSVTFCKTGDRRILGSMNDLIYHARVYLLEMSLPTPLVNMRLNEMPMSVLEFRNPKEALLTLGGQLRS